MIIDSSTFISIISVVMGLFSITIASYSLIRENRNIQNKLKLATEYDLEEALGSNDLYTLGNSLENIIGKFNVYEYVTNPNISNKIDRYVEKLSSFVGTDDRIKFDNIFEPPIISDFKKLDPKKYTVTNYVNKNFTKYENWNVLAKLRRDIEIFLKDIAKEKGLNLPTNLTAGILLKILKQKEIISEPAYKNLKYSIAVANRAIHGLDVDVEEANEAMLHAYYAIELIKNNNAS